MLTSTPGRSDARAATHLFEAVVDLEGPAVAIVARGELDASTRERLDELVDAVVRIERSFRLDCVDVSFIDAAGISALVRAHHMGATVVGVHGAVRRTLELVGLAEILGRPATGARPSPRASAAVSGAGRP